MKITPKQLKQIIKEELSEMIERDTEIWSMVKELQHGGMTESGIMIELNKLYTSGAAGTDAARQWGEWMSYADLGDEYQASTGDITSWQQMRGIAGLVEDLKQVLAARGIQM